MGTSHLIGSLDDVFPIAGVVLAAELLIGEVGCDIEEGYILFHEFSKLL